MKDAGPRVGVLALQGGFAAHVTRLPEVGATGIEVRLPADIEGLDGLILPGGESSTIMKGIASADLGPAIRGHQEAGLPILGTCAGMILAGRENLGLIEITTRRNAFGRQLESFEDDLDIRKITESSVGRDSALPAPEQGPPFRAVFIRAPWVEEHSDKAEVLAGIRGHPVAVRQDNVTALSFHPELTPDSRIHTWFVGTCRS